LTFATQILDQLRISSCQLLELGVQDSANPRSLLNEFFLNYLPNNGVAENYTRGIAHPPMCTH
jgi:hypothetical protein